MASSLTEKHNDSTLYINDSSVLGTTWFYASNRGCLGEHRLAPGVHSLQFNRSALYLDNLDRTNKRR